MNRHAVVVGAGPVGALSALLLARHNVSVTLIERNSSLLSSSRAATFHPSTLDLLETLGIRLHLASEALIVDSVQWRNNTGALHAEFKYSLIEDVSKHAFRVHLEQQHLLDYLADLIRAEPEIETCFNTTVVDLDQRKPSVVAVSAQGRKKNITTGMIVGCDGPHSTVRRLAELAFPVIDYPTHAIRATVTSELADPAPNSTPESLSGLCYFRDKEDGVSLLRMRSNSRLIVRAKKSQSPLERLAVALSNATPWRSDELVIENVETYRLRRGVVEDYLSDSGKVVVLGDAAHQTSTAGGLNMNSGIHDAFAIMPIVAKWLHGQAERSALSKICSVRKNYISDKVIPRTERRVQGLQDNGNASVRDNLLDLHRIAANETAVRQFLIESSLLDSPLSA